MEKFFRDAPKKDEEMIAKSLENVVEKTHTNVNEVLSIESFIKNGKRQIYPFLKEYIKENEKLLPKNYIELLSKMNRLIYKEIKYQELYDSHTTTKIETLKKEELEELGYENDFEGMTLASITPKETDFEDLVEETKSQLIMNNLELIKLEDELERKYPSETRLLVKELKNLENRTN